VVERGGLENRCGPFGPPWVRIPPPPLQSRESRATPGIAVSATTRVERQSASENVSGDAIPQPSRSHGRSRTTSRLRFTTLQRSHVVAARRSIPPRSNESGLPRRCRRYSYVGQLSCGAVPNDFVSCPKARPNVDASALTSEPKPGPANCVTNCAAQLELLAPAELAPGTRNARTTSAIGAACLSLMLPSSLIWSSWRSYRRAQPRSVWGRSARLSLSAWLSLFDTPSRPRGRRNRGV
jgi:hypothetical protein